MSLETRIHELAAQVADLLETVAAMSEQIKALQAEERAEVVAPAPPAQINVAAPVVNVQPPEVRISQTAPAVNVTLPTPPDCVISHEWGMSNGHYVPVRSFVTRN